MGQGDLRGVKFGIMYCVVPFWLLIKPSAGVPYYNHVRTLRTDGGADFCARHPRAGVHTRPFAGSARSVREPFALRPAPGQSSALPRRGGGGGFLYSIFFPP